MKTKTDTLVRDLRDLGGTYAQEAFRSQFPAGHEPKIDNRTPEYLRKATARNS